MFFQFSIFTPTYNRVNTLNNVYECLLRQTYTNFEWIIVDDGSSDGTQDYVKKILNKRIPIKFIRFDVNSGKHIAQNRALDLAEGELFLPLDSDDTIVDNALEILHNAWMEIPSNEKPFFSSIGCHCMDISGKLIGTNWPEPRMVSNDLEITFKYHVKGEKWGPIRTDIMLQYKNKEVKGHYFPESTVWFRIAKHYKKLYIDEKLRYYSVGSDSVQINKSENLYSLVDASYIYVNEFFDWYLKYDVLFGIKRVLSGVKAVIELNHPLLFGKETYFSKINPFLAKMLILISSPYYFIYHLFLIKR